MTAANVATLALSAAGTIASAKSQAASLNYQAEVARQQAARERQIAERDAQIFRRNQRKVLAASRARNAAAGVQLAGSALLTDNQMIDEIELGTATIRAMGQAKATQLEQQAALNRARAGAARNQGFLTVGRDLLKVL